MSASADVDLGPLIWVKGEIDLALNRAQEALGSDASAEQIKFATTHLHQARGALSIVGLDGITQFCTALEEMLSELAAGRIKARDQALSAARRSLPVVRQFLDDLVNGSSNQPLTLMPLYAAIQELRGEPTPVASDLFFPDLTLRPPKPSVPGPQLSPLDLARLLRTQRAQFQRGLLTWLRNPKDRSGLRTMCDAVAAIERSQPTAATRAFWWVSLGMLEALAEGGIAPDVSVKRLCARIDLQMRRLMEGSRTVAERLLRDTLYQVATAKSHGAQVEQVRTTYQLEKLIPSGPANVELEPLKPVLRQLRETLQNAKDAWNRFSAGAAIGLPQFHDRISTLNERVGELREEGIARLAGALLEVAVSLRKNPLLQSDSLSMELATALLVAEAALDQFGRYSNELPPQMQVMADRLRAILAGRPLGELELAALSDMSRRAQERLFMSQLAREIQTNLAQIEQALDAFFRDNARRGDLVGLSAPIKQVEGALQVLGEQRAVDLLRGCARQIRQFAQTGASFASADFEDLAHKLSALGFFVDALQHGPADLDAILAPKAAPAEEEEAEPEAPAASLEAELAQQREAANALAAQLKEKPQDAQLIEELKGKVETIRQDASLIADAKLESDAAAALAALREAPENVGAALANLAQPKNEVAAPSADTMRLAAAPAAELDAELLGIFIEEAHEVLGTIASQLQEARQEPHRFDVLTTIRRGFHTLKGSGRMVGLRDFGEAAWAVEQLMNRWLQLEKHGNDGLFGVISNAHTLFSAWVAQLEAGGPASRDAAALIGAADRMRQELDGGEEPTLISVPAAPPASAPPPAPAAPAAEPEFDPMAATDVVGISDHLTFDLEPPPSQPSDLGIDFDWNPSKRPPPDKPAAREVDPNATLVVDINDFALDIEPAPAPSAAPQTDMSSTMVVDINSFDVDLDLVPEAAPSAANVDRKPAAPDMDSMAAATQIMDFANLAAQADAMAQEAPSSLNVDIDFAAVPDQEAIVVTLDEADDLSLDLDAAPDFDLGAAPEPPPAVAGSGATGTQAASPPPSDEAPDNEVQLGEARISRSLFDLYCSECRTHLAVLQQELHALQENPDAAPGEPLVRAAHTLAGISRTVGVQPIADLARALEHAAEAFRTQFLAPQAQEQLLFAEAIDELERQAATVTLMREPAADPDLVASLNALTADLARKAITGTTATPGAASGDGMLDLTADADASDELVLLDLEEPEAPAAEQPAIDLEFGEEPTVLDLEAPEAPEAPAVELAPAEPPVIDLEFGEEPAVLDLEAPEAPEAPTVELAPDEPPAIDLEFGEEPALLDLEAPEAPVAPAVQLPPAEPPVIDLEFGEEPALLDLEAPGAPVAPAVELPPAEPPVIDLEFAEEPALLDLEAPAAPAVEPPPAEPAEIDLEFAEAPALLDLEPPATPAPDLPPAAAPVEPMQPASGMSAQIAPQVAAPAAKAAEDDRRKHRVQDDIDPQLLPIFIEEGQDLLRNMGKTLRDWKDLPQDPDAARQMLRLLHTIKGSARMAGAMSYGELIHAMEGRVESAVAEQAITPAFFDDFDNSFDRANLLMERLERGEPLVDQAESAPEQQVAAEIAEEEAATPGLARATLRVAAQLIDRFVNEAGEISIARTRIEAEIRTLRRSLLDLTENVIRLRNQLREVEIQAESQMLSRIAQAEAQHTSFDPLEMDRFTRLQELTRMMAESVGDVTTVQQTLLRNLDNAEAATHAQSRLNRELSQALMGVRLVPFDTLSDRLYRIVRQAAKEMSKKVNLDIRGGQTEFDREVLEKMTGPIEHLVRNAVAHGIETADLRLARGKAETGQITLLVGQEGNEVYLELSDDGGGLDFDAIRRRGVERGLLAPDAEADSTQLTQLIFEPGFTTVQQLSELAGRGVGMDVVKSETTTLGGRLEVSTEPGGGTHVRIYLPQTLALMQAVLLGIAGRTYAVPSAMVEQVAELKPAAGTNLRLTGYREWQNNRYTYRYAAHLFGWRERAPAGDQSTWVLLLRAGTQRVAMEVDVMRGNQEVVVKQIGQQLSRVPGIAGATVLGDGELVLIINPITLVDREARTAAAAAAAAAGGTALPEPVAVQAPQVPLVMVVDDSLTVRKITTRLLEREGYRVVTAKDGVDALEQLLNTVPDVMLLDIEMPRMDGFDVTRNVRADANLKHLPIIMITSRSADKHRNYAAEIGVNHYLGKPYVEEELLRLVAQFTGREIDAAS
ncbi:MAG: Hpt domain-containing protein [Rhodocyclaceae bacterium]|nr:Hpt domain-containing protein [Rhodocyclaceae bacterium]